jgi:2-polyprenyl-6-methoxyphenol hydroxylase-like FAD-dependent oxidoreductase
LIGQHAIVVGGSIGGLLAAEVLCRRFERVTLVERDRLPQGAVPRKGVPQSRQTHGLLAGGRQALEHLLPGITAELISDGAVPSDVLADAMWFLEGGWLARRRDGLDGLLMSRPLLEAAIRRRVLQHDNLVTRDECALNGFLLQDGRVIGVRLGEEALPADLVVDATGRGSRTPQWLEAMGYERPREQRVEVGIRYMTRLFRRRPEDLSGATAVIIPPTPQGKRGGVMLAQEGDRWTVTLVANFCEPAPSDVRGFVEHARRLPHPLIHQVIRRAEPLGEPEGYNFPSSIRRMYEELTRVPDGLIVIGDAICSFNPIYGQGMSVSALEALVLATEIDEGLDDLPRRFFKRAAAVVDVPWSIAVGSDLRIPETVGPRSAMVSCLNWYLAHLHQGAQSDSTLAYAFMRVANLIAPPQALFAPSLMLRVLRGSWKRPGARPGVPAGGSLSLAERPRVAKPI